MSLERRPEPDAGVPAPDDDIRIVFDRHASRRSRRHPVRTSMEAAVCDWLMEEGIAHRHAAGIFTVRLGARRRAAVYVPDIVLHDPLPDGRVIIIEPHHVHVPKDGGTRLLAAFRRENGAEFFLIAVAHAQDVKSIDRSSYDLLVDLRNLDALRGVLPIPR